MAQAIRAITAAHETLVQALSASPLDSGFRYRVIGEEERPALVKQLTEWESWVLTAWKIESEWDLWEKSGEDAKVCRDGLRCIEKIEKSHREGGIIAVFNGGDPKVRAVALVALDDSVSQIESLVAPPQHWPLSEQLRAKFKEPRLKGAGSAIFRAICDHSQRLGKGELSVYPYGHAREFYKKQGMVQKDPMYWTLSLDLT